MLLVTESAPSNKRGWYGAYARAGAAVGVILANLAFLAVSTSMSDEAFTDWGWRLLYCQHRADRHFALCAVAHGGHRGVQSTQSFAGGSGRAGDCKEIPRARGHPPLPAASCWQPVLFFRFR